MSGGFLASSMLADTCYALPEAEIRVMNLPAMARHEDPLERLTELSASSPVFAPGVDNYLRMGAIEALWEGDLRACWPRPWRPRPPPPEAPVRRQGRTRRAVSDRVRRDAADPPARIDACRHDWIGLARIGNGGCAPLSQEDRDAVEGWRRRGLPLVVARRQPADAADDLRLGLSCRTSGGSASTWRPPPP